LLRLKRALHFQNGTQVACSERVRVTLHLPLRTGKSQQEVAGEILSYFLRNPEAADNLVGIARWRLLEEAVHRTVAATEGALRWLIAQGYLEEVHVQGTENIFQLNPEKREEAELFLKDLEGPVNSKE
jgi:hypothetical protein